MPAAYVEIANATEHEEFRKRTKAAVVIMAMQVKGEAASPKPPVDVKRNYLADRALQIPSDKPDDKALFQQFLWAIAATVPSGATSTDGDLLAAAQNVWNDIAGVTAADST